MTLLYPSNFGGRTHYPRRIEPVYYCISALFIPGRGSSLFDLRGALYNVARHFSWVRVRISSSIRQGISHSWRLTRDDFFPWAVYRSTWRSYTVILISVLYVRSFMATFEIWWICQCKFCVQFAIAAPIFFYLMVRLPRCLCLELFNKDLELQVGFFSDVPYPYLWLPARPIWQGLIYLCSPKIYSYRPTQPRLVTIFYLDIEDPMFISRWNTRARCLSTHRSSLRPFWGCATRGYRPIIRTCKRLLLLCLCIP